MPRKDKLPRLSIEQKIGIALMGSFFFAVFVLAATQIGLLKAAFAFAFAGVGALCIIAGMGLLLGAITFESLGDWAKKREKRRAERK